MQWKVKRISSYNSFIILFLAIDFRNFFIVTLYIYIGGVPIALIYLDTENRKISKISLVFNV